MKNPKLLELSYDEAYKEPGVSEVLGSAKSKKITSKNSSPSRKSVGGGNDAINLYLKELRSYPLLSREEEVHYSRLSRKGDEESTKKMILSNLRLVLKIARKYQRSGVDFLDLVEEGNLGLIHAVEKYDPEKGFRFSTYATWWIRQNIERAIMNQRHVVRLPIHIQKEYNTFKKRLRDKGGDINMSVSAGEMPELFSAPLERVRKVIEWNERSFSTVSQDDNGDFNNIVEFLPDDDMADPCHLLELDDEDYHFDLYQANINDRDREILIRRYGIDGEKPLTLRELGEAYNVSRERVRQIIQETIQKIRREFPSGLQH